MRREQMIKSPRHGRLLWAALVLGSVFVLAACDIPLRVPEAGADAQPKSSPGETPKQIQDR